MTGTNPATAGMTTTEKVKAALPGTTENKLKKQGQAATTGGAGATTQGTTGMDGGYTGADTTGTTGYTGADTTTTGTTGTTGHTGHHGGHHGGSGPTTAEKVKGMVPGTQENKVKKATGGAAY